VNHQDQQWNKIQQSNNPLAKLITSFESSSKDKEYFQGFQGAVNKVFGLSDKKRNQDIKQLEETLKVNPNLEGLHFEKLKKLRKSLENPHYPQGDIKDQVPNIIKEMSGKKGKLNKKIKKIEKKVARAINVKKQITTGQLKTLAKESARGFVGPQRPQHIKNNIRKGNVNFHQMQGNDFINAARIQNVTANKQLFPSHGIRMEKVTDVDLSSITDFNFHIYFECLINSGNRKPFPIGAEVAKLFELYHFKRLVFHYVPFCVAAIGASGDPGSAATGDVCMGIEYNIHDPAFNTFDQIQNSSNAVSAAPFARFSLDVLARKAMQVAPLKNFLMNYSDDGVRDKDQAMYDMARMTFAVKGVSTPYRGKIAEIWVEYQWEGSQIKEPSLDAVYTYAGYVAPDGAPTHYDIPFSTAKMLPSSTYSIDPSSYDGNTLNRNTYVVFPAPGKYIFVLFAQQPSAQTTDTPFTILANGSNIDYTIPNVFNLNGSTGTSGLQMVQGANTFAITINAITVSKTSQGNLQNYLKFQGPSTGDGIGAHGTLSTLDMHVFRLPSDFSLPLLPFLADALTQKEINNGNLFQEIMKRLTKIENNSIFEPSDDEKFEPIQSSPSFVGKLEGLLGSMKQEKEKNVKLKKDITDAVQVIDTVNDKLSYFTNSKK